MKEIVKKAFVATLPVMAGYVVLGFGFGIVLRSGGYSMLLVLFMSVFIYAGSMQYVAVGLLVSGASLITVALTTLMVNARHLFYGVSMLERYKKTGARKPYLIFALTDETYSLVCTDNTDIAQEKEQITIFLCHCSTIFIGLSVHCLEQLWAHLFHLIAKESTSR